MTEMQFMELYSAMLANQLTPVVDIDTTFGEVIVPREFIEPDGHLRVCISPEAVRNLRIEDGIVYCRVTFQREPFCMSFPLDNVTELFAENGDIE